MSISRIKVDLSARSFEIEVPDAKIDDVLAKIEKIFAQVSRGAPTLPKDETEKANGATVESGGVVSEKKRKRGVSQQLRRSLWRSVTSYPPYRKYYIYLPTSTQTVISQLQSLYLSTYYFWSITRYKSYSFSAILESAIGPFVQEFFANQPSQFLYLMTSEFIGQEVTKAAIA